MKFSNPSYFIWLQLIVFFSSLPIIRCVEDIVQDCAERSAVGQCQLYPLWMSTNCGETCSRKAVECKIRYDNNACSQLPEIMLQHCPKSCNVTTSDGHHEITFDESGEIIAICNDKSEHCPEILRDVHNICTPPEDTAPNDTTLWLQVNCKRSCGLCREICHDKSPTCPGRKLAGECDGTDVLEKFGADHLDWMRLNCPRTCDICGEDTFILCDDLNEKCAELADAGNCELENERDWMRLHCPKACQLCT